LSPLERPLVIKFGGTSVGGGAQFVRAARIAAEAARDNPVAVVVSAMSGTTDTLLGYARMSSGWVRRTLKDETLGASIAELRRMLAERHLHAAREAVLAEHLPGVEGRVVDLLGQLEEIIGAPSDNMKARRDEVDPAATRERSARYVSPLLEGGLVAVVPGYVGRSPGELPTTLGRGGSDLSATVLGRALDSDEVWIMSDVEGVLDADPQLVPHASLMPRLSYREAGIFAGLGAKVLHPRTMEPASEAGIEVFVRNTFAPDGAGTHVTGFDPGAGVRCVALRQNVAMEIPCTDGREGRAAMVVCIGSPDDDDLERGRRCLREAGIPVDHFGIAAAGLVFVVSADEGIEALRALHAGLIPPAGDFAGEEVA
jgi:aspartate kinase